MLRLGLIWLKVSFGTLYNHINRSFIDLDLLIAPLFQPVLKKRSN